MRGIRISSRYAKSLLELCKEQGQLEETYADMKLVLATIRGSHELTVFLNSPVIKADKKEHVLNLVFANHVGKVTKGFMDLLARKGREMLLREIAESFIAQVMMYKGITSAEVSTAYALDAETLTKLQALAVRLAGGQVELKEKILPELIGGFVLKVGDNMIDTSISGEIRNLEREFEKNPYVPEL